MSAALHARTATALFEELAAVHAGLGLPPVDVVAGFYETWRNRIHNSALYATLGGPEAGIRHVREMSQKGPFIRAGMNAANVIDLIPNKPDASADWNAGFRAGFKEELERMHPEVKRR